MTDAQLLERQKWFVNLRFGMFIHFNSGTFQFANNPKIKDWEYDYENHGKPRYEVFKEEWFNPTKLDCKGWAKAAKKMGMTFGCLTSKHHEGFDLWPSEYTDHCVKNAAISTDVIKEYVEAFRSEGLEPGLYFSMLDVHHRIGRDKCTEADKTFIKNQLRELLTNYGEIPFIIFDGWQAHWGGPSYKNLPFEEIDEFIKSIQPNCLVINHSCESNLNHTDVVFYENAAGQSPDDVFCGPGAGGNILTDCWFNRTEHKTMQLKSAEWAIEKINDLNKRNVTFLLNCSPNQEGTIDDNMLERYEEIGKLYKRCPDLTEIPPHWLKR